MEFYGYVVSIWVLLKFFPAVSLQCGADFVKVQQCIPLGELQHCVCDVYLTTVVDILVYQLSNISNAFFKQMHCFLLTHEYLYVFLVHLVHQFLCLWLCCIFASL